MTVAPELRRSVIYEGTRIPHPVPTLLRVPDDLAATGDVLTINFGPNHPSTHGVLRLVVDLYGEEVVGLAAVIGYLHTGFEKSMEQKSWWKAITYPERIDYLSYQHNELVFVLAIEKLLGLETPPKASWMRTCLCELNRIHSHLVWLGTAALELGAISMFWYCFRERERILDLFEMVCGARMHTRYFQTGGLAEDIPSGFFPEARRFVEAMPKGVDEYRGARRQEQDLARAYGRARAAFRRGRDRARPVRARSASLRRRLGSPAGRSLPFLRRVRVPRACPPRGRRLRALPGAHGGDA